MNDCRPLNPSQSRFVDELLATPGMNATEAYCRTYGLENKDSAAAAASRLMADERIQALIAKRQKELRDSLPLTAGDVVRHLAELSNADPRDLVSYFVGACRYCHGENFKYQRTPAEYEAAFAAYRKARALAAKKGECLPDPLGLEFDHAGGVGFSRKRPPNPDCPECDGLGEGYEVVRDTRTLSPAAARLYAGVKRTKNGLEVNMRSADKALQLAGSHLGLWKDRVEMSGPNGAPIEGKVTVSSDPQEAAAAYQQLMQGGA
jgi:phage terminase small subunit